MQAQKVPAIRAIILIEERWLPLISNGKVQVAIAIHIGGGNAPGDLELVNSQVSGQVEEATAGGADEEAVMFVAVEVVARLESRPVTRVLRQFVVA